jgi:hypothetical protein
MYKIFLDHLCINVLERILKVPTHPITQKQTVKSHHNIRSSQHIPATARTKTYQNSCLQKALYELKEMNKKSLSKTILIFLV